MLINFVVFTILFLIFDFIIYNKVSLSLYKKIDQELIKVQEGYIYKESEANDKTIQHNYGEIKDKHNKKGDNPRIILITRNADGEITNNDKIGQNFQNYVEAIKFDKNDLMKIYNIKLENEYVFRGMNFETKDENGNIEYVQLLANVDGETQTLNNLLNMLVIGTVVLISISILASYILSKRMMLPIYKAYEKQTEFVENASHELRTPLTIIQAKQQLLLQEPESKIIDKSEEINLTLRETRRLTKMIKELMDLARSDSNEYKLNKENVDIDKLIMEVVGPYRDYAELQDKKIDLDLKYGKEIFADKNKITELLIILLDNAIKYTMPKDTITIKTYYKDRKCNIEVIDTGIGISDEGLKRVFDRFYREDKARTREKGGTINSSYYCDET